MELMEKTLTSKLVYDGGLLKVHYDTVELINGRTSWREVIRHPGAVVMVPIDDEDNIYLVRQYRYPYAKVLLEVPAASFSFTVSLLALAEIVSSASFQTSSSSELME